MLTLIIPDSKYLAGRRLLVRDFASASLTYRRVRNVSGETADTFRDARLIAEDGTEYRISYNGRVWNGGWPTPIHSPRCVYDPITQLKDLKDEHEGE